MSVPLGAEVVMGQAELLVMVAEMAEPEEPTVVEMVVRDQTARFSPVVVAVVVHMEMPNLPILCLAPQAEAQADVTALKTEKLEEMPVASSILPLTQFLSPEAFKLMVKQEILVTQRMVAGVGAVLAGRLKSLAIP